MPYQQQGRRRLVGYSPVMVKLQLPFLRCASRLQPILTGLVTMWASREAK